MKFYDSFLEKETFCIVTELCEVSEGWEIGEGVRVCPVCGPGRRPRSEDNSVEREWAEFRGDSDR